jgi:hypothetical protein
LYNTYIAYTKKASKRLVEKSAVWFGHLVDPRVGVPQWQV